MARYDKYEPKAGGFRATLAADYIVGNIEKPVAVGLNASGLLVVGNGTSGIKGLLILTKAYKAGSVVDVMTDGQVVEFGPSTGVPGTDFGVAATTYYGHNDGSVTSTKGADGVMIGHTIEGQRLTVRVQAL